MATNFSSATTSLTFTNTVTLARSDYHTFQLFSNPWTNTLAVGTNTVSARLDLTIDGANWFPYFTNTFGSATTNWTQVALEGAFWQGRWVITCWGTNLAIQQNYMGKRE